MDDILLNKLATIERCIKRIHEEYDNCNADEFSSNYTKQDAIILNIQRACETAIDIGSQIIKEQSLELPQSTREIFVILEKNKIINSDLSQKMQAMVGFCNIAVHDYDSINLDIVKSIIENYLEDLRAFAAAAVRRTA